MNTKGKLISLGLLWTLVFMIGLALPQRQTKVLAADASKTTLTIEDGNFYKELIDTFKIGNNQGAVVSSDDTARTITLNMENVTWIDIEGVDMAKNNSKVVLKKLLTECTNLKTLQLVGCNLSGIELPELEKIGNFGSLTLVRAGLTEIPNLKLKNLTYLNLSQNNFYKMAPVQISPEGTFQN